MARIEDSRIVCRWPVKRQAGARMSEVSSFSFLSRHAAGPNPQGVSLRRSDRANFPTALLFCRALGFLGIKLLRRPCRHLPLQKGCVILKVITNITVAARAKAKAKTHSRFSLTSQAPKLLAIIEHQVSLARPATKLLKSDSSSSISRSFA